MAEAIGVAADLLAQMEALDPDLAAASPELTEMRSALADGIRVLRGRDRPVLSHGQAELNDVLAGATPYLPMSGLVVDGWLMTRSALAASRLPHGAGGPDALFLREKIGTAGFYAGQLLPQAAGLLPAVTAGAGPLFRSISAAHPSGNSSRHRSRSWLAPDLDPGHCAKSPMR